MDLRLLQLLTFVTNSARISVVLHQRSLHRQPFRSDGQCSYVNKTKYFIEAVSDVCDKTCGLRFKSEVQ